VENVEQAIGLHLPSAFLKILVGGAANRPQVRPYEPDQRYGHFMFPGHALGAEYCRIHGAEEVRHSPLVSRWTQRRPDNPLKPTISYADTDLPLAGIVGPGPSHLLEQFIREIFATVRVEPLAQPGDGDPHGPVPVARSGTNWS
jgi:hypothetical protein